MTGTYEGAATARPDAYGRWLVAANYLTAVPGCEDGVDVATALHRLAAYSGDLGAESHNPAYDPFIAGLRAGIAPVRRTLFDLFAPLSVARPDPTAASEMAERLTAAALRCDPLLDPRRALARVERPVHIVHGADDRLIPSAEGFELRGALPPTTWSRLTVTGLVGHASHNRLSAALHALPDVPGFARALSGVLAVPGERSRLNACGAAPSPRP
jgi:pimeloyl-ACP methyl ester carboxylesterase